MRLTNIQLIHATHHTARYLPKASAEMVRELATRLDVSLVALHATQAQRDQLAAENAGLKSAAEFATAPDMWEDLGGNVMRYQYQEWYADKLKAAMKIPATDAFLAEVRAQGVEMFAALLTEMDISCTERGALTFATKLRQGGAV